MDPGFVRHFPIGVFEFVWDLKFDILYLFEIWGLGFISDPSVPNRQRNDTMRRVRVLVRAAALELPSHTGTGGNGSGDGIFISRGGVPVGVL